MKKLLIIFLFIISIITGWGQKRFQPVQLTVEEKLNNEYCTGLFKMDDGIIFDLQSDYNSSARSYSNVLAWLDGRVAGLQVYTSRNGTRIPFIRGQRTGIYLDEIQVSPDILNSISVNDIAMIKVIKGPFYGGFNGAGGAIAIYTLKGYDEEEDSGD